MVSQEKIVKWMNSILLVSTFAAYAYADAVYEAHQLPQGKLGILKYVLLFTGMAFCYLQIFLRKRISEYKIIYLYEAVRIAIVVLVFAVISMVYIFITGKSTMLTLSELIKMIIPIVYAIGIINVFNFKEIYNCMVGILIVSLFSYVLEIGIQNFTLSNLSLISFSNSYSPFESHYAAANSIAMCTFFMYYRENKALKYISFLFALLTFKRLAVLFAILLWILPIFVNVNQTLKKRTLYAIKIGFIFLTSFYYYALTASSSDIFKQILGISRNKFTMGRNIRLTSLLKNNYVSYGFGSTTDFLGKNLELDLIKILLEVSIIGLIVFVFMYFDIAKRHLYCTLYMTFIFVNLLTSHSLTGAFSWILNFIITGCINYKQGQDLSYLSYQFKHRKRVQLRYKS